MQKEAHSTPRGLPVALFWLLLPWTLVTSDVQAECRVSDTSRYNLVKCNATGYAMVCEFSDLAKIPKKYPPGEEGTFMCVLDLSNNNITKVYNNSFKIVPSIRWLDLSENELKSIDSDAFRGLDDLIFLNLSGNHLVWPSSYGQGIFKPLVRLQHINLKENEILTTLEGLDTAMDPLHQLETLHINSCPTCVFGKGFARLTMLRNISLSGRSEGSCNMPIVTNSVFQYLSQIEGLWIASCNISKIAPDAFINLTSLVILDFSYNERIKFYGMNEALTGLKYSSTLETLRVNRIHDLEGRGTVLKYKHVENLMTLKNLKLLHMDLNRLEIFEDDLFDKVSFPGKLSVVTFTGNRITAGRYTRHLSKISYIKVLDISRQHLVYDPFVEQNYGPLDQPSLRDNPQDTIEIPKNLKTLYWRKGSVYASPVMNCSFANAENLTRVDMSHNLLLQWTGSVKGLANVEYLDLSENNCFNASPIFFKSFTGLKSLNVSKNFLGHILDPDKFPNNEKMFSDLNLLQHLDMSENHIGEMSRDIFRGLRSLYSLDLSDNHLRHCYFHFSRSQTLRDLDLSNNKLYTLPKPFRDYLDGILSEKGETVHVNMSENPIICTCNNRNFLKWLHHTRVNISFIPSDHCKTREGSYGLKYEINALLESLERECTDRSWIITLIVGVLTFVICIVSGKMVYKYRWRLRYFYYRRNRRHNHAGYDRIFENDAFISYETESASFIKNQVVPKLEDGHNLRLWLADRNAVAGTTLASNIFHAISSSRKTVLLISKRYFKSNWCDYEMNMAKVEAVETKRSMIIVVLMDDVETKDFPVYMLSLLKTEKTIDFPTSDHQQELDAFWSRLASEIIS